MTSPAGGDPWRLFVALPCPVSVRDGLAAALAPVREQTSEHLRWVPEDTWHLTLAFLGDVENTRADIVTEAVEAAVVDHAPFEITIKGASRFGRGLLFLSVDDEAFAAASALGQSVRRSLAAAHVWADGNALHPHLTLARQRDRRGRGVSRSQLDAVQSAAGPRGAHGWTADEVVVFRSHLSDGPVRHEPLARVALS